MPIALEVARMMLGLLIAGFHRPLADFIVEQDRQLEATFRARGLRLPPTMSAEASRNLFFLIGIFVTFYECARLWLLHRP
jgi:hypothetical protein